MSSVLFKCLAVSCLSMGLYLLGLAILLPFVLPALYFYDDSRLISRSSGVENVDEIEALNRKSVFNFYGMLVIPAILMQVVFTIVISHYAASHQDLRAMISGQETQSGFYDIHEYLKTLVLDRNAYVVEIYKQMPIFGWQDTFEVSGNLKVTGFDIFSLFHVLNLLTAIVGVCIGCLFLAKKSYHETLGRIYYALEGGKIEERLFVQKKRVPFVIATFFFISLYLAMYNLYEFRVYTHR